MAELESNKFAEAIAESETIVVVDAPNPFPPNRPRKVYAGMWGTPEIGAVAAGALAVAMALVAYFFWVVPSNNLLVKNKAEADRLETELVTAKTKYGEITSTESQVSKIVESIDDFEARFLPATSTGQAALYQRLNALIGAYGLVNTTGPDYVPLETADNKASGQSEEERGRSKFRSIYPGVYATMTLEGSYQNLRRFIREIETGREFIVVSAVELAPTDGEKRKDPSTRDQNPQPAANPINPSGMVDPRGFPGAPMPMGPQVQPQPRINAKQQGKTHGETVSLHIELAAYFRRQGVSPATAAK